MHLAKILICTLGLINFCTENLVKANSEEDSKKKNSKKKKEEKKDRKKEGKGGEDKNKNPSIREPGNVYKITHKEAKHEGTPKDDGKSFLVQHLEEEQGYLNTGIIVIPIFRNENIVTMVSFNLYIQYEKVADIPASRPYKYKINDIVFTDLFHALSLLWDHQPYQELITSFEKRILRILSEKMEQKPKSVWLKEFFIHNARVREDKRPSKH